MANVSVPQLRIGDKITQDVLTPLGSVLFNKDKVLLQRDLDILDAFLVTHVSVDRPEDKVKEAAAAPIQLPNMVEVDRAASVPFYTLYDQMVALVKKAFQSAIGNEIPIMTLRSQLELLVDQISEYNILTFMPAHMSQHDYMYHNAVLVALTSYNLAKWQAIPAKELMQVALAGLLHDIGNAKIDPEILFKPSALTAQETEEVRHHTAHGYNMLKGIAAINEGVKRAALQHHEKIDGSGYPLAVKAAQIHPYAKIVAVADIFHAMTLNRVYQKKQSPYAVLEQLAEESFGKLDAEYVQTFIHKVTQFQQGMTVKLSNGQTGEIVFTDRDYPIRPWVSVQGQIINLVHNRNVWIDEIISN